MNEQVGIANDSSHPVTLGGVAQLTLSPRRLQVYNSWYSRADSHSAATLCLRATLSFIGLPLATVSELQ